MPKENPTTTSSSWSKKIVVCAAVATCANLFVRGLIRKKRRIELKNKVMIITGASSGHGLILARQAANEHAILVIAARNADDLELTRQDLLEEGAQEVLVIPTDIRDYGQVQTLISETIRHFGRIDILVNNAGIMEIGPSSDMSISDFDDLLSSNFWGALYATYEVLPHMKAQQFGRIANVVSVGGKRAVPHMLPYTVSKFALAGFTEGIATELSKDNIFVTAVYPSIMNTGGHTHAWFKGDKTAEYRWFGMFAVTPLVAASPDKVASKLLEAVRNGDPHLVVGWPAKVALAIQSVCPNLVADFISLIARALPTGKGEDEHAVPARMLEGSIATMLNKTIPANARPKIH